MSGSNQHSIAQQIVDAVTLPDYPELAELARAYLSLEEQYGTLREAAQELDDLNPTLSAFMHDELWGAAARKLHATLSNPAQEPS